MAPTRHQQTIDEQTTRCTICLSEGCDLKIYPCGHVFHWECPDLPGQGAMEAARAAGGPGRPRCPNCRTHCEDFYNLRGGWWEYDG